MNLMDYVAWRGDLPYAVSPFNDVDAAVFATFCYNDLGDHAAGPEGVLLGELTDQLPAPPAQPSPFFGLRRRLLREMAASARWRGIRVRRFVSERDPDRALQFSAVTVTLPDGCDVVCFRGTDATLVGWREDFMMSYESPVPAQTAACAYLHSVAADGRPFVLAGHSKGGNLAAYAAAHADADIQQRILMIYSFDGPGLDDETAASAGYEALGRRVRSMIPQSSVIGLLMNYDPNYTIVRSSSSSLMQHDLFSWQVKGPGVFDTLESTTFSSQVLDRALHDWLKQATHEERRTFVDTVFELLSATGATTTREMKTNFVRKLPAVMQAAGRLDAPARRMLISLLGRFVTLSASSAWNLGVSKELKDVSEQALKLLGGEAHDP